MKKFNQRMALTIRFVRVTALFVLVAYSALASATTEQGQFVIVQGGCEIHPQDSSLVDLWVVVKPHGAPETGAGEQEAHLYIKDRLEAGRTCQQLYAQFLQQNPIVMTLEDRVTSRGPSRVISEYWLNRDLYPPVMVADFVLEKVNSQRLGFQVSALPGGL